ncbi:isochorismatase family protein [Actinomadura sediminis]|uniref:Isochorismatase family protein n=1 Tax=Actinomadura sediminis TaxID=1038904 RepID=A0ABW3EZI2_9ACTN
MSELIIEPARTALVVIDLQVRIVGMDVGPHAGADVVRRSARLADAFRAAGGTVVVVRAERPGVAEQPPGSGLVAEIAPRDGDLAVTKHTWNAFHRTGLHERLDERGIGALVLSGLVTNAGVESTARAASDHDYDLVFPEDAMSGFDAAAHRFAVERIFPLLGTVTTTDAVLAALG